MQAPAGYSDLAALLSYPDEETLTRCLTWLSTWNAEHGDAAALIASWYDTACTMPLAELQELYTHTFDLNPSCSLDIGYYLFGEDYQRGAFMALLREELDRAGLPRSAELPDHLPGILRWLERVYGTEEHLDMVQHCLLPVLATIDQSFDAGDSHRHRPQPTRANPYRLLLRATAEVLREDLVALGIEPAPEVTIGPLAAHRNAPCAARGGDS